MLDMQLYSEAFNEKTMGYSERLTDLSNIGFEGFSVYVALEKAVMQKFAISSLILDENRIVDMLDLEKISNKRLSGGYDDCQLLLEMKMFYSACERKTYWKSKRLDAVSCAESLSGIYNTCMQYFDEKYAGKAEEEARELECEFLSCEVEPFNDYILGNVSELDYDSLETEYPLMDWHICEEYIVKHLRDVREVFKDFFKDADNTGEEIAKEVLYHVFQNSFDIWDPCSETLVIKYDNPAIHEWDCYKHDHMVDEGELERRMDYLMSFFSDGMIDGKFFYVNSLASLETGRLNLQFYLKEVDEVIEELSKKYQAFVPKLGKFDAFLNGEVIVNV